MYTVKIVSPNFLQGFVSLVFIESSCSWIAFIDLGHNEYDKTLKIFVK